MALSYEEFKTGVQRREFGNIREYQLLVRNIDEFYPDLSELKYFYPKNLFNEKETELIFLFEDGLMLATLENNNIKLEHFKTKVVSKQLLTSLQVSDNCELILSFDNDKKMIFKSLEDASSYWYESYAIAIRDLYRLF